MKIMGKVRCVCAKEEGQSANGNFWEKQTLVLNTTAGNKTDIPVAITFFGERRTKWLKDLKEGQLVDVAFAIESRQYDDKWYTDVQGFGLTVYQAKPKEEQQPVDQNSGVSMPDGGDEIF